MRARASALLVALLTGCGAAPDVALSEVQLPFALPVACGEVPADLQAVLWQAGSRQPTPLEIDLDEGTTSGRVEVTTGEVRHLVVDWHVEREVEGETVRVLLAQFATDLDLTRPESAEVALDIAPEDIDVTTCRDVRFDLTREGSETQLFLGDERPACDLDESCALGLEPECTNLGEVCAGLDPLAEL